MNINRIKAICKRWTGQFFYFSPVIAFGDFITTIFFRYSNSKIKYTINKMYYEKAKDIIYLRYNNIIEKWIKKEGITDNLIDEKSNIFIFWWQGINNAPKIIKGCINTIYENSGLHKVVILDKTNWNGYIQLPEYVLEKMEKNIINFTQFSDILRFFLLYKYGGIWIDPTCLITNNLSQEIYRYKFYTIRHGDAWEHPICKGLWCTFFMAAGKGNYIMGYMKDLLLAYWKKEKSGVVYLLPDTFLAIGYEYIPYIKQIIEDIPMNNEHRDDFRKLLIKSHGKNFDGLLKNVDKSTYIHKLTYKMYIEKFDE